MSSPSLLAIVRQQVAVGTSLLALLVNLGAPLTSAAQEPTKQTVLERPTASPIKHVIVIIGENRTFDHVFATYKPKAGETISNLLSKGIINAKGQPGPNFFLASQSSAVDSTPDKYDLNPPNNEAYEVLPPVLAGGYTVAPSPTSRRLGQMRTACPTTYTIC